jgi:hypothetical protein
VFECVSNLGELLVFVTGSHVYANHLMHVINSFD